MPELTAIIDRFEGEYAVLILTDGQILNVYRNFLDKNSREGDQVILTLNSSSKKNIKGEKKIRQLLAELTHKDHENS
ncbi:MAG: DUF3006 domain-containing protein [Candidatus Parcubacteria bacterium]|nr:DUF3006 domain-containing protein [Candidatus Parcubacteria bacterium]